MANRPGEFSQATGNLAPAKLRSDLPKNWRSRIDLGKNYHREVSDSADPGNPRENQKSRRSS